MHTWVICALLIATQQHAICWRMPSREPSCDRLMLLWLDDAVMWHSLSRDVPNFMPQVSCSDSGSLPTGGILIDPGEHSRTAAVRAWENRR
ncbi:MAG TPA: hypothetical protein VFX20_18020 [Steroidobacteraceae bacterium]|nr:hypothetical protein [Steroidobacteraceae bacterium]